VDFPAPFGPAMMKTWGGGVAADDDVGDDESDIELPAR
jgi:hypothetical protein